MGTTQPNHQNKFSSLRNYYKIIYYLIRFVLSTSFILWKCPWIFFSSFYIYYLVSRYLNTPLNIDAILWDVTQTQLWFKGFFLSQITGVHCTFTNLAITRLNQTADFHEENSGLFRKLQYTWFYQRTNQENSTLTTEGMLEKICFWKWSYTKINYYLKGYSLGIGSEVTVVE